MDGIADSAGRVGSPTQSNDHAIGGGPSLNMTVSEPDNERLNIDAIVPSQIAHFVIYSSRFAEVTRWYKTVLCATANYEDPNIAFLTYDSEHHRVAIVNVPNLQRQRDNIATVHHIAFTYCTLRELLLTWKRLNDQNIAPVWSVNHGPTTSIYYCDPDGNRIELQVDNFDSASEAVTFCAAPEFAENSVGVDIDPRELLRRLNAGEAEAALKRRPNVGPRTWQAESAPM